MTITAAAAAGGNNDGCRGFLAETLSTFFRSMKVNYWDLLFVFSLRYFYFLLVYKSPP